MLYRVMLENFVKRTGKKVFGISRPAQSNLMAYGWPGNIRELENILEQAAMMTTESFIRADDLPRHLGTPRKEGPSPMSLGEMEKKHVQEVLQRCAGNRTKASTLLGISRRALIRKIQKLGLK